MSYLSGSIKTKLAVEVYPARFLSLGFGNIADSEANIVCVSSFVEDMGRTIEYLSELDDALSQDEKPPSRRGAGIPPGRILAGHPCFLDLPEADFGFRGLLVICKGTSEQSPDAIATNVRLGLARAIPAIGKLQMGLQLDTTAMGVGLSHGHLHVGTAFDIISQWIDDLFSKCENVDHVRLVTNMPSTFVDLFESLHRQSASSLELSFTTTIDSGAYEDFDNDVAAAARLIRTNPKQTIVICRTIIESVARHLCHKHSQKSLGLYKDITNLKNGNNLPEHIHSYLQTCRVLGNFSNHTDFAPSNRDAEAVMLLTLRVVEWFLGLSS